jgi:CheY-like chemotaxis protein
VEGGLKSNCAPDQSQSGCERSDLRKAHEKLRLAAKIAQRFDIFQGPFTNKQGERGEDAKIRDLADMREDAHQSAQILRRMMRPANHEDAGGEETSGVDLSESRKGRRVLLADDDPMVLSSARMALTAAGYSVVACPSGLEAWAHFSRAPRSFDLILTDISMPSLDGASLVQQALLLHPNLKVILISGYVDERAANDLIRGGKGSFIAKPFGLSDLVDEVRKRLAS